MKTSSAKNKGRRLQTKVVQILRELYDLDKGITSIFEGDIQSVPGGVQGVDVKISPSYQKKIPLSIECKNQERWQVETWFAQAKKNTKKGTFTTLVISKNRHKPLVVVDAEIFFKLIYLQFKDKP